MRIAVNTRFLLKSKLEGIGWFTFEVVRQLVINNPQHEFIFLFDRPFDEEFIFAKNIKPVVVSPPARHPLLWYMWFEWSVPFILKRHKVDLFFSPDGYLSLSSKVPSVVVMHDLAFEHHPEDVGGLVSKFYRYFTPRYAKKAARILTVSEFTKKDIHQLYDVTLDNIDVVYNGVNNAFAPVSTTISTEIKKAYALDNEFFVYVGALHPRKNIKRLFEAFDQFKKETNSTTKLVIVGRKAWSVAEIENTYNQMQFKDEVVFTGRLGSEDLRKVIASAKALTYVPYFEGFGIPIIEAQKCETAVITSNITSMPEAAGDGALLVDPYNVGSIVNALKIIDSDEQFRQDLIAKGIQNVQRFSWEKTAEKVWRGLMKVVNNE